MRLVEICVDGGLEATMHSAQAQLADAYLTVGAGIEARVIAEDLVAREPWDRANIERFRRALTLLGETDIDAIIAERLERPVAVHEHRFPVAGRPRRRGDRRRCPSTPTAADATSRKQPLPPSAAAIAEASPPQREDDDPVDSVRAVEAGVA